MHLSSSHGTGSACKAADYLLGEPDAAARAGARGVEVLPGRFPVKMAAVARKGVEDFRGETSASMSSSGSNTLPGRIAGPERPPGRVGWEVHIPNRRDGTPAIEIGESLRSQPQLPARHHRPVGRDATARCITTCGIAALAGRIAFQRTWTTISHVRAQPVTDILRPALNIPGQLARGPSTRSATPSTKSTAGAVPTISSGPGRSTPDTGPASRHYSCGSDRDFGSSC